jgi:hypothetical protein
MIVIIMSATWRGEGVVTVGVTAARLVLVTRDLSAAPACPSPYETHETAVRLPRRVKQLRLVP